MDAFVAPELAFDDLYPEPFEVRAVAGGEVVEDAYVVAALEQCANEVRADESGSAGDESGARHQTILPEASGIRATDPAAITPIASHVSASSGTPATNP